MAMSAFVVNFFVMPTDAGGITTIATARSTPQIPSVSRVSLEITGITSVSGTVKAIHSSG